MNIKALLCTLLLCATLLPTQAREKYEVFLLIGQSNMAGRGRMLPQDRGALIEDIYLLDEEGKPTPATSPLNQYSTIGKGIGMQQINPGNGFAPVIAAHTGSKVLLVVNARGGTSISQWADGAKEGYFAEAVKRAKAAKRYGKIRAILWHQGESDSGGDLSHYMSDLSSMVEGLRKQIGCRKAPFVAGEIAPWHKNRDRINPIIGSITEHIENSSYVSSEGLTPLIDESDPHFDRTSQFTLGERYAKRVIEMVY